MTTSAARLRLLDARVRTAPNAKSLILLDLLGSFGFTRDQAHHPAVMRARGRPEKLSLPHPRNFINAYIAALQWLAGSFPYTTFARQHQPSLNQ
jgi:hypothetical protein